MIYIRLNVYLRKYLKNKFTGVVYNLKQKWTITALESFKSLYAHL